MFRSMSESERAGILVSSCPAKTYDDFAGHPHLCLPAKTWMAGSSPAMTDDQVNRALGWRLTEVAHSPASIFLPSAGCTRVTLKRPSAQTTVKPSASTATISPILPAIPLGSL